MAQDAEPQLAAGMDNYTTHIAVLLLYYSREGGPFCGKGNGGKGGRMVIPKLVTVPIEAGKCQWVGRAFFAILLLPRAWFWR